MVSNKDRFAVFLDIDKTLTVDSYIPPEKNIEAINEARKNGHMVFINTGRSFGNISPELKNAVEVDGYVTGNGSYILFGDEVITESVIDKNLIIEVFRYVEKKKDLWCFFEGETRSIAYNKDHDASFVTNVSSYDDFIINLGNEKISEIAMGKTVPQDFIEKYNEVFEVLQFRTYADVVQKGYSKANGMQKIIEKAGIDSKNTMAIGDSLNDYKMVEFAGIGVAVENACEQLKSVADVIVPSNDKFGVAYALDNLLKK